MKMEHIDSTKAFSGTQRRSDWLATHAREKMLVRGTPCDGCLDRADADAHVSRVDDDQIPEKVLPILASAISRR